MKTGDIIIFPTDTVYGLGTRLYDTIGLKKIYELKKRTLDKKIPVLLPDLVSINQIAIFSSREYTIMKKFWPGNLTLILKSSKDFYKKTGNETVAVRIPNHPIALEILKEYGPMWTTSANISGSGDTNDISMIKKIFKDHVYKIYDDDDNNFKAISSTIIDLTSSADIKLIRQGEITLEQIIEVIKNEK